MPSSAVDDKSNEITAHPALLRLLDLEGGTATIGALSGQTASAAQVVARGGEGVLALKDNHPPVPDDVRRTSAEARANGFAVYAPAHGAHARTADHDRGWLEMRRYWTLPDPALLRSLDPTGVGAKLRGIGLVEAERHSGEAVTVEQRYYLLRAPTDAATFGRAARRHWGIENRLRWVLDVTFGEDACQVREGRGAQNLAVLRQERARRGSFPTKRFTAALGERYLATVLASVAADLTTVPA